MKFNIFNDNDAQCMEIKTSIKENTENNHLVDYKDREEKALVSVIVPIYNCEKYLNQCIQSLIEQTYKHLEIILINDESIDNSGNYCDNWQAKDNRIKVFHKKNKGVSSTRNYGLNNATGKYITFIDGDDWILNDTIEKMINHIDDVDCVYCGCKFYYTENNCVDYTLPNQMISKDNFNNFYVELDRKFAFSSCCGKLYKKSILDKYNIRFEEGFAILEDGMFVQDYLKCCNKIRFLSETNYIYRQREGEQTLNKKFNINEKDALNLKYKKEKQLRQILSNTNLLYYHRLIKHRLWNYGIRLFNKTDNSSAVKKRYIKEFCASEVVVATTSFLQKAHVGIKEKCKAYILKNPHLYFVYLKLNAINKRTVKT